VLALAAARLTLPVVTESSREFNVRIHIAQKACIITQVALDRLNPKDAANMPLDAINLLLFNPPALLLGPIVVVELSAPNQIEFLTCDQSKCVCPVPFVGQADLWGFIFRFLLLLDWFLDRRLFNRVLMLCHWLLYGRSFFLCFGGWHYLIGLGGCLIRYVLFLVGFRQGFLGCLVGFIWLWFLFCYDWNRLSFFDFFLCFDRYRVYFLWFFLLDFSYGLDLFWLFFLDFRSGLDLLWIFFLDLRSGLDFR